MVLDEKVLDLRDLEFLPQHTKNRCLGGVDHHVVAARLVENATVNSKLIVALEDLPGVDRFAEAVGLVEHRFLEHTRAKPELGCIEEDGQDAERRR
jgi:hypothetical protein